MHLAGAIAGCGTGCVRTALTGYGGKSPKLDTTQTTPRFCKSVRRVRFQDQSFAAIEVEDCLDSETQTLQNGTSLGSLDQVV